MLGDDGGCVWWGGEGGASCWLGEGKGGAVCWQGEGGGAWGGGEKALPPGRRVRVPRLEGGEHARAVCIFSRRLDGSP